MSDTVSTLKQLESLYSQPARASVDKETSEINAAYRSLIEAASFVTVASVGYSGLDCSPRGDKAGFVHILDSRTVALPDRRGNNRLDTLRNVLQDPRIALLFLIPGLNETLRINGRAHISTNENLLASFEVDGSLPVTALVIKIETMFFQCARALKRSQLWNAESKVDPNSLPRAGELIKSVVANFDADEYDTKLATRQASTLY
ncbi:MAG: pyridoxamine 5'-phosphate oxidase family protein [Granulosicoccus sp.]